MSIETVADPVEFVAALGGLHDVRIERVTTDFAAEVLEIAVVDLDASFAGLPGYAGERPCALIFRGLTDLAIDVTTIDGVRIHDVRIDFAAGRYRAAVYLNNGSGAESWGSNTASLRWGFETMELEVIAI